MIRKLYDLFLGTTFKKIAWVSFVVLAILLVNNTRTVSTKKSVENEKTIPNYANKDGYEIVSQSDYEKYQQGYCLAENKILSDEEIFTRGISQYLEKTRKLEQKLLDMKHSYISYKGHLDYEDFGVAIDYYMLDEINATNWFKLLTTSYAESTIQYKVGVYRDLFFNKLNGIKVDPLKYLTVDMKSMWAGFSRPIIFHREQRSYKLYLDRSFVLIRDAEHRIVINTIYISERHPVTESAKKNYYIASNNRRNRGMKIDHCGNVEYDIDKYYKESEEDYEKRFGGFFRGLN